MPSEYNLTTRTNAWASGAADCTTSPATNDMREERRDHQDFLPENVLALGYVGAYTVERKSQYSIRGCDRVAN